MSYFFELSFNTKFILVIITITIILDILFQKTVFAISINFVSSLREKIPQENLTIYKTLSHLGKEQIIFPIIYIIYICYPIKYSFLLFNVYFSSKFFVNFLKLSFQSPRPFWNNISIFGKCNNGFGNPSAHSFTTISIYSSICHVIISNNKNNFILKVILIFLTVFISIITCFSRIILGVHSIDQVIFGFFLGLCFYIFVFHVYHINCNSNNQILNHINLSFKKMCLIILMIILAYLGLLNYRKHDEELNKVINNYSKQIKEICPSLPESKILYNDSLLFFVALFSIFSAFIALKFEFYISFENNSSNWSQYNFEIDENEKLQMSRLTSNISITKPIQWNHTSICKSIFRLIFTFIMVMLSGIFYFLIKWDNPKIYLVIFVKVCLSESLISFGMFFTFKVFLKWLKLSNMTLFFMLRESI